MLPPWSCRQSRDRGSLSGPAGAVGRERKPPSLTGAPVDLHHALLHHHANRFPRGEKLHLLQRIAIDNYPLLIRVALASDCICRGPRPLFQEELATGALQEVPTRRAAIWESACLTRPESTETPLVRLLVRLLVEGSKQYGRES